MALLPLFQIADATIMQWQNRWKSIIDPLLQDTAPNLQVSPNSSTTTQLILAGTTQNIPNLSVNIKTKGGPVLIWLQGAKVTTAAVPLFAITATGAAMDGISRINTIRDGEIIARSTYDLFLPGYAGGGNIDIIPVTTVIDTPAAGTHTYTMSVQNLSATCSIATRNLVLVAYELK